MGWLTAHDVEAVVSPSAVLQQVVGWRSHSHDPFQDDLFIAPGNEELAVQIREVSCDPLPHARRRGADRSAELGHGRRAPSMPGAHCITNGRCKLRTHRCCRPRRVPPLAPGIRRAVTATPAL
jgi:hypothetical protein